MMEIIILSILLILVIVGGILIVGWKISLICIAVGTVGAVIGKVIEDNWL